MENNTNVKNAKTEKVKTAKVKTSKLKASDVKTSEVKVNELDNSYFLSNMSIIELNACLEAICAVCSKYEQKSRMNVGSYDALSEIEMIKSNNILRVYQEKREKILLELEKRIDKIC